MKICFVVGTRPELIKMAPVIKETQNKKINFFMIHTNQHYSDNLSKIFLKELKIPKPKYHLKIDYPPRQGAMTGLMLEKIEDILLKEKPDIVLVEGDTNSVLAGALAAVKLNIPVGHIEAGLRSYDRQMPEEINRIIVDHCSDLLFAPTKIAANILENEGIDREKIFITGNTIVDAVFIFLKIALSKSKVLKNLKLKKENYILATIHRAENVDNKNRLQKILNSLREVHQKTNLKIILPLHPRTKKRIEEFSLQIPNGVEVINPLGYFDFLVLEKYARIILTDSGGVQEEACILKVPCVTLRDNTERPETVEVGSNIIVGVEPEKVLMAVDKMLKSQKQWKNPFGDGKSAKRIVNIIERYSKNFKK
jgi:UDP-N-acetylglucosamine 2-epimerase (non-hydrolysing)